MSNYLHDWSGLEGRILGTFKHAAGCKNWDTYQSSVFSRVQVQLYAPLVSRFVGQPQVILHQRVTHHHVVQHRVSQQNQY